MVKEYLRKLIFEILQEKPVQEAFKEYILKKPISTLDIWDVIQSQSINKYVISIDYFDENGQMINFEKDFDDIRKMRKFINTSLSVDGEIISVRSIDVTVWYVYKNARKLKTQSFTEWSKTGYEKDVISTVFENIENWCKNHPEFFL